MYELVLNKITNISIRLLGSYSFSRLAVMKCMGLHETDPMLRTHTALVFSNPFKYVRLNSLQQLVYKLTQLLYNIN